MSVAARATRAGARLLRLRSSSTTPLSRGAPSLSPSSSPVVAAPPPSSLVPSRGSPPSPSSSSSGGNAGDDAFVLYAEGVDDVDYSLIKRHRCEGIDHLGSHAASSQTLVGWKDLYQYTQMRHYTSSLSAQGGGRWMRISGTYNGPLVPLCIRHPFLEGGARFKSRNKQKKQKAKKREVLAKIKRIRVYSKKRKEEMTEEEGLEFRLERGRMKMDLIKVAIGKFPVQEIPPENPDLEVLTAEQRHYLKKMGYKNKNYVPVGRRGIFGGTIQNIHLHWKKHETVQVEIAGFTQEEIKVMANQLARLSGGILIDIHQKNIVILYRGRNYQQPKQLIPMKTLDKRKALQLSVLQQSLKDLQVNDRKLVDKLAEVRREKELRLSGQWVEPVSRKGSSFAEPEEKLEDPDEYSEWSYSEGSSDEEVSNDEKSDSLRL